VSTRRGFLSRLGGGSPPTPPDRLRIALWGPTGAGKSWLLYALSRELELLNARDERFDYFLDDEFGHPVRSDPENPPGANDSMVDTLLTFTRRPRAGQPFREYRHQLHVHDNMGKLLVNAGVQGRGDDPTEYTLSRSTALIVLLDASSRENQPSAPELGILADDRAYASSLQSLIGLLDADHTYTKYLAVCVSKVDVWASLRDTNREQDRLVQMMFKRNYDMLRSLGPRPDFRVGYSNTSAVGFLPGRGPDNRRIPNFNPANGAIAQPAKWRPHHVSAPFFWIFEEIEKAGLSERDRARHPRYPPPTN